MPNAMNEFRKKFNTGNGTYLKVKRENLNRSYRTVTVRFSSYDVERINRYLMEKKISQSELLRKIVSKKELSYTVKKSTGSRVVLNAMKTFSVEDRLYRKLESWSDKLSLTPSELIRELILSGIKE
ncbi:hypothetical protein [Carboxydothermus ferrireducens]|uniref:CopG family antitoxin n=2 Tax=Carboxydothermus TaxID=129957 RepID=A0ABX2R7F7_9THEO|nr:hypothetical protein [Carboxydothermus ferrireducens]NYE57106.1 putative CopG family antitoxin [Carboxydothermus ferrireducens DSM 11255]